MAVHKLVCICSVLLSWSVFSFAFTTPDKPQVDFLSPVLNSGQQTIRVTPQGDYSGITRWGILIEDDLYGGAFIMSATPYPVDIALADNNTYNITVSWGTTIASILTSLPTTITVGDRSAPQVTGYMVNTTPVSAGGSASNSPPDSRITINWSDRAITGNGVNWSTSKITINVTTGTPYKYSGSILPLIISSGNVITSRPNITGWGVIQPPGYQDYATTYKVEVQLVDFEGNSM